MSLEFGGLDRYLEAPYVIAARDEEEYEQWCDPTAEHIDTHAWTSAWRCEALWWPRWVREAVRND